MSDTLEKEKIEESRSTDQGDHDKFAHYCPKNELDRWMLEGTPVTAICGKKWVPAGDYAKYPICPTCLEIYQSFRDE